MMADRGKRKAGDGEGDRAVFSRSAAACNGCRGRKQKCGGQRPVCARCHMLEQQCIWPQQKKRGPSKGYNEALETRVNEMEHVLFRIVSAISFGQLSQALDEPPRLRIVDNGGDEEPSPKGTVTRAAGLDKETAMEYWAQFPLRTAADVQAWHKNRYESSRPISVHEQSIDESSRAQDLPVEALDQRSRRNNKVDMQNDYENSNDSVPGDAMQWEILQPPPNHETRQSHEKTAHLQASQEFYGNYFPIEGGQHPLSGCRSTFQSNENALEPPPVNPGGPAHGETGPSERGSSGTGEAGVLGFSREF